MGVSLAGDDKPGEEGFSPITAGRDALVAGRDFIIQGMPPPVARSAYLEQVRRIAPPSPPGLQGRDAELAELARFCLAAEGASYLGWHAGPWAGKSALLSTFVLHPPPEVAERVTIVSFFITARLAALLGQPLPSVLPQSTREAFLLGLLSEAASKCRDAGRRLVLVVDGLDEDRGVTTGPSAHSIAGLLPADPPAGMRVIVAGRPNPPVPDDVPDWHPLRDPAIIRLLPGSPHARDIERLSRQELQRLPHGSPAEQGLLGLLAAARGGLSAWDLAELADIPRWEVTDILHTAAGRTFQGRPSLLEPADRPDVYLLGHEELQAVATDYLGDAMAGYRERLHAWAAKYRASRWPRTTPEYLFTGYFHLLEDLGGLPRMTECALDVARHDRMLDLTGGDAAALAEARTVLERIAVQDEPDLASALALACHRDHMADRNAYIPVRLPAAWAALGQLPRAQALAATVADPYWQATALVQVAEALARAGHYQQAVAIAAQAEGAASSTTDPVSRAIALAGVARALARTGQHLRAEAIARSIAGPDWQATALARVAEALARAGHHEQAEAIARSVTSPDPQVHALAEAAGALARAGQPQQAEAIAAEAEGIARSITNPSVQATALAQVAEAVARTGRHQRAEALARSINEHGLQAQALAKVAAALAENGQHWQAEAMAGSITDPRWQIRALAQIGRALAGAGQNQQAEGILAQAETIARSITSPYWQAIALSHVAEALARAGDIHEAARASAVACSAGPWTTAIKPVLFLVPPAVTALVRVLEEQ